MAWIARINVGSAVFRVAPRRDRCTYCEQVGRRVKDA
jgi:hypothetical protein